MTRGGRPPLGIGEAAPWFHAPALDGSQDYAFHTAAGRPVLMLFFGSAATREGADALAKVQARRGLFDDLTGAFYGVAADSDDAAKRRIRQQLPGIRFLLDYDGQVSLAFGADPGGGPGRHPGHWLLLDRMLRVAGRYPIEAGDAALDAFAGLVAAPANPDWAPVVMAPNVLEPELCRYLISLHEADGGEESGFMRDVGGKTRLLLDPSHKVRRDYLIKDGDLSRRLHRRLAHRLVPMVRRAFQFDPTRVERLLVGCYEAEAGGHFRAHRDNTTKGTAHRRFAVTINLNAEDYEGGDLVFPEFGARPYRPPTGGAVVFSCSLLHRAMPVTRGRRFAFLPFLYDDAAALLREQNAGFVEGGAEYRAGTRGAG